MTEDSVLDPEAIENLRALGDDGDDSFLQEVIEIFTTDTPNRIAELRSAHAAGDQTTFTRAAHSIKGSSSNVGARRLGELALSLEKDSRIALTGLDLRIPALEAAFEMTRDALRRL